MSYMVEQKEKSARASMRDASVSTKHAIMLCKFLRGKQLDKAIELCERIQKKTVAVPFTRFTNGVGHRRGEMAAGRYPVKTAKEVQELLESVKSNATNQGLSEDLMITHLAANRASRPARNRLKFRGEFKRTHLEVQVTEMAKKSPSKEQIAKEKPSKPSVPAETGKKEKSGKETKSKETGEKSKKESSQKGAEQSRENVNVEALQRFISGFEEGDDKEAIKKYHLKFNTTKDGETVSDLDDDVKDLFLSINKEEEEKLLDTARSLLAEYEGKNGN